MGIEIVGIENPVMDFNVLTNKMPEAGGFGAAAGIQLAGRRQCRQRAGGSGQAGRQMPASWALSATTPTDNFASMISNATTSMFHTCSRTKAMPLPSASAWRRPIRWPGALLPRAARADSRTTRNWIKSTSARPNTCTSARSARHRSPGQNGPENWASP